MKDLWPIRGRMRMAWLWPMFTMYSVSTLALTRMYLALVWLTIAGTYTLPVSAFEARQHGQFTLSVESTLPVSLVTIPAEGAGMYSRTISGTWCVWRRS